MRPSPQVALLACCLILAGCAQPGSSRTPGSAPGSGFLRGPAPGHDAPMTPAAEQGIGGDWEFVDGTSGGRPVPAPTTGRATLSADGSRLTGTAFCNGYGGQYRVDGDRLTVENLAQTEMACLDPRLMAGEAAFMGVLGAGGTRFTRTADELVLENGAGRLRFRPQPPVPTRELVGTRWVLDTLIDDEVASSTVGEPAVLQLSDDGTFTAGTGCRTVSGRWRAAGDTLTLNYGWTDASCPPGVAAQEQHLIGVLGNGFRIAIDRDRLTVTAGRGGRGLSYRAEA